MIHQWKKALPDGAADIMNGDQRNQFTSFVWTDRMKRAGTKISMDGKRRCITFYNHQRPHAADGGQPPAVVYVNQIQLRQQAQKVA